MEIQLAPTQLPADQQQVATKNRFERHAPPGFRAIQFGFRNWGTVAPRIMGWVADYLFFKPQRYPAPPRELSYLETAHPFEISFAGRTLQAYRWGKGPTVMLIHGWSGRGTQLGAFIKPLVQAGFQVVAFDAPAHGKSPGSHTNFFEYTDALHEVVDSVGPVQAIIAHSAGAVATTLALSEGMSLEKTIFIAPPSRLENFLDTYAALLEMPLPTVNNLRRRIEKRFGSDVWKRLSIDELASVMTTPALIVHDRDDTDILFEEGEHLARSWPGAHFVSTSGLGHRRILRNKRVVRQALTFLKQA